MKNLLLWGFLTLFLGASALAINLIWFKPVSFRFFTEREFVVFGLNDPELMSQLGIFDDTPFDFYNGKLTDASLAHFELRNRLFRSSLKTLESYDRDSLSADDQLSYDILSWFLKDVVEGEKFRLHDYVITQNTGAYLNLVDLMSRVHPVTSQKGVENYLSRLAAVAIKLDQQLSVADHQASLGIVLPSFIIQKVLLNLKNIRGVTPDHSPYFTAFSEKVNKLEEISDAEKSQFRLDALALIKDSVYPAYDRHIAYFQSQLRTANDNAGAWKLPDGDNYYRYQIRSTTTSDLAAADIHELGIAEVSRIEAEMEVILSGLGYVGGTPAELMNRISNEPRFGRPDTGEAMVARFEAMEAEMTARIDSVFNKLPRAELQVHRIPHYLESTVSTHYLPPSINGSRPGVFFINPRDIPTSYSMRTLAYHEGVPGHHFQIGLQSEQEDVPTFRKVLPFTAFVEGWALYAERLAWELGFHDDPFENLGRLEAELFRAARLVVDTGIHHKGWSRQQAMDYFREHYGKEDESEIERYVVWPGQALAYKIGMQKFLALRAKARIELGDKFNLRDFHDVVIGKGAMPFAILEQQVNQYIARVNAVSG